MVELIRYHRPRLYLKIKNWGHQASKVNLTCAVDQDIKTSKFFCDGSLQIKECVIFGQVTNNDSKCLSGVLLRDNFKVLLDATHQSHSRTVVKVPVCETTTNSARRSSDQHDFLKKESFFLYCVSSLLRVASLRPCRAKGSFLSCIVLCCPNSSPFRLLHLRLVLAHHSVLSIDCRTNRGLLIGVVLQQLVFFHHLFKQSNKILILYTKSKNVKPSW